MEAAAAPFRGRADVELLLSPDLDGALAAASGADGVVLVPVSRNSERTLAAIRDSGASNIIVVAAADDADLRAAAFGSGARDVLMPPHEAARVEEAVSLVLGRPLRRWKRCAVPIPAMIAASGKRRDTATVLNVSPGGAQFESALALEPGEVFQLALKLPAPFELTPVFARTISSTPAPGSPLRSTRAQFVGLNVTEIERLESFLASLDSSVEDFAAQMRSIQKLDARRLRVGFTAGVKLPVLVGCERAWLDAAPGSAESDLAVIPLARCRAALVTWLFDALFASGEESPPGIPPFKQWRGELKMALDLLNGVLGQALASGDPARVRELRDVQARIATAIDQIERLAERVTGQKREKPRTVSSDTHYRADTVANAAENILEEAKADRPAGMPQGFFYEKVWSYRKTRRVAIIAFAALFGFCERSGDDVRHTVYPSSKAKTDSPAMIAGMVRVRSVYSDAKSGNIIAVVDGSWFGLPDDRKMDALKEVARQSNVAPAQYLEVRDYAGDLLATWVGGARLPQPLEDGATPVP